ncbi:MAG: flagellar biosynthesis anti-sigma factor FlgM [Deltaproteobacteria bacterium]|nr:flagellar biosynthesis anti-sigma factor FlgM [Deltaproteobacteria bacterium]
MKVSDTRNQVSSVIQQYEINGGKGQADPGKPVSDVLNPEEKVSLSAKAKEIQSLKKAIESLPDVREEKVQELKEQIEQGSYRVNGEKVAESMLRESILDILA